MDTDRTDGCAVNDDAAMRTDAGKPEPYAAWVAVTDRLPPPSEDVGESIFVLACDFSGALDVVYYDEKSRWWEGPGGVLDQERITHWMPLPELPPLETRRMVLADVLWREIMRLKEAQENG